MQFIGQTGMAFNDRRNRVTLAWAVVGLILSKSIHLSGWSIESVIRKQPVKYASFRAGYIDA